MAVPSPVRVTKPPTTNVRNPVASTVGVAATLWARNNPPRIELHFINLGANTAYISPTADVTATNGIPVAPNGGNVTLLEEEDGELVRVEWFGIAPAGAVSIFVLEVNVIPAKAAA